MTKKSNCVYTQYTHSNTDGDSLLANTTTRLKRIPKTLCNQISFFLLFSFEITITRPNNKYLLELIQPHPFICAVATLGNVEWTLYLCTTVYTHTHTHAEFKRLERS